jgi:hypothetical protein
MTLTEFLLARIAEDEAVARQTNPHRYDEIDDWDAQTDAEDRWGRQPHGQQCGWGLGEGLSDKCKCGYPARVLVECEAKRRIVDYREQCERDRDEAPREARDLFAARLLAFDATLRALALPYAGHPGYDEKWRP